MTTDHNPKRRGRPPKNSAVPPAGCNYDGQNYTVVKQGHSPKAGQADLALTPDSQDADLARQALRAILKDAAAPAPARAAAARTLAEMAGALGRHAAPPAPLGRPISEATRAELEAELAALTAQIQRNAG